jgi:hypothetical protein
LICTSNSGIANDYGQGTFGVVIPFDKTRIGVCSGADFW